MALWGEAAGNGEGGEGGEDGEDGEDGAKPLETISVPVFMEGARGGADDAIDGNASVDDAFDDTHVVALEIRVLLSPVFSSDVPVALSSWDPSRINSADITGGRGNRMQFIGESPRIESILGSFMGMGTEQMLRHTIASW